MPNGEAGIGTKGVVYTLGFWAGRILGYTGAGGKTDPRVLSRRPISGREPLKKSEERSHPNTGDTKGWGKGSRRKV